MKRRIAILLSIFFIFQLCSCAVKEPEPSAETDNTVIEISRGGTDGDVNKLAASAVAYTDRFESADGSVSIEINLDDTSLYEGGFRTLQITPRPFTGEEVRHIANVTRYFMNTSSAGSTQRQNWRNSGRSGRHFWRERIWTSCTACWEQTGSFAKQ